MWLAAPAKQASSLRLPYESLVQSVRLPFDYIGSQIALKEISDSSQSLFDPESGVKVVIPPELKIAKAVRKYNALFVDIHVATSPDADGRVSFQYGNPLSIPAGDVDTWLRQFAVMHQVGIGNMAGDEDYAYRPDSFRSRIIGGRPALSWIGGFSRNFKKWTEYLTLIHHENGLALIRLREPTNTGDKLQPTYERLVESVRLP